MTDGAPVALPIKQVDASHYDFKRYMHKPRWISVWHQLDEIVALGSGSVLEVGAGSGLLKQLAAHYGIGIETVDIDPDLRPDHVASATNLPFANDTYDTVCAFQVLEHFRFEQSLKVFQELARTARRNVLISLPDAGRVSRLFLKLPKLPLIDCLVPLPVPPRQHEFDGEHYWEIGTRGHSVNQVRDALISSAPVMLSKSFRVVDNHYHRFLLFAKNPR